MPVNQYLKIEYLEGDFNGSSFIPPKQIILFSHYPNSKCQALSEKKHTGLNLVPWRKPRHV